MIKKAMCFWALLSLLCTSASAEWNVVGTATVIVHEDSHLNGRARPVNGTLEMRLPLGDVVDIVNIRDDGWVEIIGGETGTCFVLGKYLCEEYRQLETSIDYKVASNGRVRLRTIPGGDPTGWAGNGVTVTVTAWAVKDGVLWAKTPQGYLMADFLEVAEP